MKSVKLVFAVIFIAIGIDVSLRVLRALNDSIED